MLRSNYKLEDSKEDIHNWYNNFKEITFQTIFFKLTKEITKILIKEYCYIYNNKEKLNENERIILKELEDKINNIIENNFKNSSTFIRLSTRSPKDSIQLNIKEFLRNNQEKDSNNLLRLYFKIITLNLCVHNGKEAMNLLLSSERVYFDLIQALEADKNNHNNNNNNNNNEEDNNEEKEGGYTWDMEICLREFDSKLDPLWEFRCFMYNYQLVAICQYNPSIYSNLLIENKIQTLNTIQQFYTNQLIHRFQLLNKSTCIFDVVLYPNENNQIEFDENFSNIKLIELNPYNSRTGGALFDWRRDSSILFPDHQVETVDFRLVGENDDFNFEEFHSQQRNMIEGILAEYEIEERIRETRMIKESNSHSNNENHNHKIEGNSQENKQKTCLIM